ncbi:MAG: AraC family transcriptional regulator [Saprospiraceae bacterium]|nr:AraC family transcriptional regulator [Saprospiraceae bacterium]
MKGRYRKYLIVFEQDKRWGFYVNDLGRTTIEKHHEYPSRDHPENYVFTWEKGRVLDEFHVVLITKGGGVFESHESGPLRLSGGDAFLLFPGVWHRYKPDKKTGWTEHWVGFSGNIAKQFLSNGFFNPNDPIISNCNKNDVLNYFNRLFKLFDEEPFGFQKLASGICVQLIAELYNIKNGGSDPEHLNSMVSQAKRIMYQHIDTSIDLRKMASDLNVSYSKFRLDFRKQTGVSPLQYYLLLKLEKSKEMLLGTGKTQKEIAYELGFESDHYFNRLFKIKTGFTPGQFRRKGVG